MRTEQDVWRYRPGLEISSDLTGFSIEALDGGIGKVDESTMEVSGSYLVVDTGPWIFGKKVLLPGSVIERIDYDAPEFNGDSYRSESYRTELGGYYGMGGRGYREPRSDRDELL